MAVEEKVRWRVIRAILGWDKQTMALNLGINPNTVRMWENGDSCPNAPSRKVLASLCEKHRIAIRADGFPVPE